MTHPTINWDKLLHAVTVQYFYELKIESSPHLGVGEQGASCKAGEWWPGDPGWRVSSPQPLCRDERQEPWCAIQHLVWLGYRFLIWEKHASILDSISGNKKKGTPFEEIKTRRKSWDTGASDLMIIIVLIKADTNLSSTMPHSKCQEV